jgi:putative DNA primase/helicase
MNYEEEMLQSIQQADQLQYIKNKIDRLADLKEHERLEGVLAIKTEIAEHSQEEIEIILSYCKEILSRSSISAIKKEISKLKRTNHDSELKWDMTDTGALQKTLANVCNFLITKGIDRIIAHNKFNGDIEFTADPPWQVGRRTSMYFDETDLILSRAYMSNVCRLDVKKDMILDAIESIAYKNQFHPIRQYLTSLKWDGVERLKTFLPSYTGCQDNDYTREVGMKFLCACVKRVFDPGCKFDYILVLEGAQGTMKSTFVETLAGKWYGDVDITSNNKDIIDYLRGVWINEVSEMAYLYKKETNALKGFISRKVDRVRLAYDRRRKDFPRQWVLMGTMNPTGDNTYNNDDTGARRYWSIKCTRCLDIQRLTLERDQLWAEAYLMAKSGIELRLSVSAEQIASIEQDKRTSKDESYTYAIKQYLSRPDMVNQRITMLGITATGLSLKVGEVTKSTETRVGIIMKRLGYFRNEDSHGYFYEKASQPK